MENNKKDLKILGSGNMCGGNYNEVTIGGSGDIEGDVQCNVYKVMGSGELKGNLKAGFVKISGSGDIEGNVESEDIIISGSGDIAGNVKCKSLKIAGSGDIDGNIEASEINIMGSTDVGGNCESEIFNVKGAFEINGTLNAGDINMKLKGKCNVKEICGEDIEIRKENIGILKSIIMKSNISKAKLSTNVINGDRIYLENTTTEKVVGSDIVIGAGCEIGMVEYKNKIEVNSNSKVGNTVKI